MHELAGAKKADPLDKAAFYAQLRGELVALLGEERDWVANLANAAGLLFLRLPEINWAGFYLLKEQQLVLGPFQGKPACVRIALGHGVCGTAAEREQTIVVPDVHQFAGHIACDSASNSEIVVPLVKNGRLLGVLDIDSPGFGRFTDADAQGLESFAAALVAGSDV